MGLGSLGFINGPSRHSCTTSSNLDHIDLYGHYCGKFSMFIGKFWAVFKFIHLVLWLSEGNVETSSNLGDGWGNQGGFCNMLD